MNNSFNIERILVENTIISLSAIVKADYEPTGRRLTLALVNQSEVYLRNDLAESTWEFLRSRFSGCNEPLLLWKIAATDKPKTTFHSSSEFRVNE